MLQVEGKINQINKIFYESIIKSKNNEWEDYFNRISNDRDKGQMIMALFKYARTGEPTTFNDDLLDTMFSFMAKRITQYNEWNRKLHYSAVCKEKRRKERREKRMQGKE